MKTLIFFLAFFTGIIFFSCRKYPDGPNVSLLPRKERIEGKWVAESVKYNDVDSLERYKNYIWEFTRNNSVILQVNDEKKLGIWSTVSSDQDFVIEYDSGAKEQYEIRKMERKSLWLRNRKSQLDFHLKLK